MEEEEAEAEEIAAVDGGIPVEMEVASERTLQLVFVGTEPKVLVSSGLIVEAAQGQDDRCGDIIDGPKGHQ